MEVGQVYVLNTFGPHGCMNALPLIWKFPDEYKKHVVIPGPFHTGINYMGMVTELATTSCLSGMLKAKAYLKPCSA